MRWRWLEALAIRHCDAFSSDSRPLTQPERRDAVEVFGSALDLEPIRAVRGSIVNSPTVLGNIIRLPLAGEIDLATLIHELAHVWQYQVRVTEYISSSVSCQLIALVTTGSRSAAYDIEPGDLAAPSIHDLSAEKQAVIVERWFVNPNLRDHPAYRRFLLQIRSSKTSQSVRSTQAT